MTFTRRSPWTNKIHTWDIENVTREQFVAWMNGALAQHAMPNATPEEREFIINGMTPEDTIAAAAWEAEHEGDFDD